MIHPPSSKIRATEYIDSLQRKVWHRVEDIPEEIRWDVVDELTEGKVGERKRFRVIENEDWTLFILWSLPDGIPTMKQIKRTQIHLP